MVILGVDAGCGHTAGFRIRILPEGPPEVLEHVDLHNQEFLEWIYEAEADVVVFESMLSNGGAGQEVVDTAYWNGRFWTAAEYSGKATVGLTRRAVRVLLFGKDMGGDADVIQYCAATYGFPSHKEAKGTAKNKGPLYGVVSHKWQALGVALATWNALKSGNAYDFYWDPLYTSSEEFKNRRKKRREAKQAKEERAASKGQKSGGLVSKMKRFKSKG
jgi:hypothetical protein